MLPLDATGKKKVPEMGSFGKQTRLTAHFVPYEENLNLVGRW